MPIDLFNRNTEYFEAKLNQVDKIVYPDDFDNQFNELANYLNSIVKPVIDAIQQGAIDGEFGNDGAFLHNIGDGTTNWQKLDNSVIDDYQIELSKLVKITIGSVLGSNLAGNIISIAPTADDQILVSTVGNPPVWRKLTNLDIEDNTLTGTQFGLLGQENFTPDIFVDNVPINSIATDMIRDLNITNDKLVDGSITAEKLGVFNNLPTEPQKFTLSAYALGCITPAKIQDGSIPINDKRWVQWTPQNNLILDPDKIADESLTDAHLVPYSNIPYSRYASTIGYPGDDPRYWADGFIWPTPLLKIERRHVKKDLLTKDQFTPDIQQAMTNLGA